MNTIYINGIYASDNSAVISCRDSGFLLGDGLFETLKYDGKNLQFFTEHYSRLKKSAEFFSISFPYEQDSLNKASLELLNRNHLTSTEAVIRMTLTRGMAERGININPSSTP